jgi:hypothetical protein
LDGNTKEQLIQEAINVVGKNWYFMLGYMERVSARRHGGPAIAAQCLATLLVRRGLAALNFFHIQSLGDHQQARIEQLLSGTNVPP